MCSPFQTYFLSPAMTCLLVYSFYKYCIYYIPHTHAHKLKTDPEKHMRWFLTVDENFFSQTPEVMFGIILSAS